MMKSLKHPSHKESLRELRLFSLKKRRSAGERILSMCINICCEDIKNPDTSQQHIATEQDAVVHTENTGKKVLYREVDQTLEQVSHGGCGVSILGDIQNPTGHCPRQCAPTDSAWRRRVGLGDL